MIFIKIINIKIISLGNKNEQDMYIFHDDFVYLKITIDDLPDENISQYFEDANKFISENDKVLIHCNKGISRSATIVISYLMKNGLSFDESFNLVKKKRNIIKPNKGFIEQLQQFYLD